MFKGNLSTEEIELWGHEYVRHLAGEVVQEFNSLPDSAESGTTPGFAIHSNLETTLLGVMQLPQLAVFFKRSDVRCTVSFIHVQRLDQCLVTKLVGFAFNLNALLYPVRNSPDPMFCAYCTPRDYFILRFSVVAS